ncbi:MAG: hypothetical protein GXC73_17910, partial [Chitinophagaceae bacterium]|nr:hypothetical protein [Chitinophagaceae bacterium]
YDRIKHNIYLPDYISICLLRLKYPAVYQSLYYTRSKFLTTATDYDMFDHFVGELFIRLEEKGNNDLERTELYKHLQIHYDDFAISDDEIKNVLVLVNSIFASPYQRGIANGKRALYNHHLTITQASSFERYFDFSLEGRLDQVEFETALKLPFESLKKKVEEWNTSRAISTDLIVKLENAEISADSDSFEKLIKAIVYLTYLPIPQNPKQDHSYSVENFYKKLYDKYENKINVIERFYGGDKEKFRDFFRSLYFMYAYKGKWNFLHEFAIRLIKDYEDDFAMSHAELKVLVKDSFLASLSIASGLTYDLMYFYNRAIRLFQKQDSRQDIIIPEGMGIEMTDRLKEIIDSSLSIFLNWNIFKDGPSGGFRVGGWEKVIYGSENEFSKILTSRNEEPQVQEYIKFRDAYNEAKHPIDFKFELLTIS